MTLKWTPEQELAITCRGMNLLVSAAAGAGKTAVLVERIVRRVSRPAGDRIKSEKPSCGLPGSEPVERILVVTFTEAAASEMKERIARVLRERLAEAEGKGEGDGAAHLRRQVAFLGRASISTLHSFCHSICRRYFHRLGLGPGFEVISPEEVSLLRAEVLDDLLEELYDQADPGFLRLVEAYASERDDAGLREVLLRLHSFSRSHPDPDGWLDRAAAAFEPPPAARLTETSFGQAILEDIRLALEGATEEARLARELASGEDGPAAYLPVLSEDASRLEAALRASADTPRWDDLRRALAEAAAFERLPPVKADQCDSRVKEAVQRARERAKLLVRNPAGDWAGREEGELLEELRSLAGPMRVLARLVTQFEAAYHRAKDERGAVDFADLEHLCLRVLTSPDAARELRDRFDEVLVDEYQDINEVQEAILGLVSRGDNLFMVGDVKQSIYRFRLAQPGLFIEKHSSFQPFHHGHGQAGDPREAGARPPLEEPGTLINLPSNFRSRRPVLDAVNYVFRQVMWRDARAEIDYDDEAELVYGSEDYGSEGEGGPAVELHLLEQDDPARSTGTPESEIDDEGDDPAPRAVTGDDPDGDRAPGSRRTGPTLEDLQAVEREACVMAERIRDLAGTTGRPGAPPPFLVWDRRENAYRPVRYRDIVVLMRATAGVANLVTDTFSQAGIPAYAQLNTGYFEAVEVETVLSLLRLIDNPRQDIPLAAVLRSPIVGLDENDLARLRLTERPGDFYEAVAAASAPGPLSAAPAAFLTRLEEWRTAARQGPLSELVWRLYGETGYYAYAGGLPGGSQRQANLRYLHDRARMFDQFTRQGLARFLRFIDQLRETEGDLGPPPPLGEGEDAVRIMSIHRSKGLEFPVVFLAGLGKRFNLTDTAGDLICHRELGFGPMVVDSARRLKYPGLAKKAVAARVRSEAVAEELRILYVGMTRARDRLVLVGGRRKLREELARWRLAGRAEDAEETGRPPRLSPATVAGARSFLDWLVPAVACHPQAAPLRLAADGPKARLLADPSRWEVRLWGLEDTPDVAAWAAPTRSDAGGSPSSQWEKLVGLEPLENIPHGAVTGILDWQYPHRRLATLAAKVTATELKRLRESAHTEEAAGVGAPGASPPGAPAWTLTSVRPRFLQSFPHGLTPTERGRATHLVLQHLDLAGPADRETLARLASSLAEREFITPEQAEAVDLESIARFCGSDLGEWLASVSPHVKREVPFTLAMPLEDIHGASSSGAVSRDPELVVVQGIIDVLVDQPEGLTIIDFKTDQIAAPHVGARSEAYRPQLDLYRRAVEAIWARPVTAVWVAFLHPGLSVRLS